MLFEKRMTDRVLVKGNCASGPSLVEETLSRLLFTNLKDRLSLPKCLLY